MHIGRAIATLGLVRSLRTDRTVQPTFGIAAGVQRLAVHGTSPPQLAHDPSAFSALAMASRGDRRGPRRRGSRPSPRQTR